jgi:hypothetical protein
MPEESESYMSVGRLSTIGTSEVDKQKFIGNILSCSDVRLKMEPKKWSAFWLSLIVDRSNKFKLCNDSEVAQNDSL